MASNSTKLITDTNSVITNGPSATTTANSIAAAGPIMDYPGCCKLCLLKFEEASVLIAKIIQDTDSTDSSNLTLLDGVQGLLNGTSGPSTQALTDLNTVYNNGPNAATLVKANAAAGPIMDYPGNVKGCRRKLEEAAVLLGGEAGQKMILANTDSGTDSTNRNLILGMTQVLV